MNLPPGPRISGLFGLLAWMARPAKTFEARFAEYGDLYTETNPVVGTEVIVSHPELIKTVFTGSPDVFLGGAAGGAIAPVVGDRSILLLDGKQHHRERKLLMPPFHGERMALYADVMRAVTERVIAGWPTGKKFSLLPSMQRITMDVILDAVFGLHDGEDLETLRSMLSGILERVQRPLGMLWLIPALQRDLPLSGWASFQRAIREADELIYRIISEARAGGRRRGDDILTLLLAAVDEDGQPMTDKELRDELVTLLFAGHETTGAALSWAIDDIVRRPEVHARIVEEAAGAIGPGAPQPYLDATIKEVLRLRPLTPLVARKLAAPVRLREYELPAGTLVVPCIYLAQRHPDYWDAPLEFRPERFLGTKPDPYAWLPFGGGARRCIGMAFALFEMRVVLSTVLPRVPLELPDPPARIALRSFLFAPSRGPRVIVTPDRDAPRP